VAEEPSFTNMKIFGDSYGLEFYTGIPFLEDCETYFWRVTAQAAAGNATSNIIQFWTDFEGTCPKVPECSEDALEAPSLVLPENYSIVTTPNPELVYQFNTPDCAPESSEFWVSEDPSFSTYAIHGAGDYDTATYPDAMIFGTGIEFLDDCTTYYWKVEVRIGDTTLSSPVGVFGTDFSGTCRRMPMCTGDQLATPVQLSPIGGEVVNSDAPALIARFDLPDCAPETTEWWVSSSSDLSSPVIYGRGNYISLAFPDMSIFQPTSPYLEDCDTYYWKVRISAGGTYLDSVVEDFRADFAHECFPVPDLGRDFSDLYHLRDFNIGCIDPDSMFATFVFEEPIQGNYEAHIGTLRVWPCSLLQGHENALICSGQAVSQGVDVQVDLFSLDTQAVVLSQIGFSALCEEATQAPPEACQPPANGCTGNTQYWCQQLCMCVQDANNCH
jgi:hypothetical protein